MAPPGIPGNPVPLKKEHTLNHNIKTPMREGIFLIKGYWALWDGHDRATEPHDAVGRLRID